MQVSKIAFACLAAVHAIRLPDPNCKTGVVSVPNGEASVCCAGYCGECGDYPTCGSVRGQDSENACCKTKVLKMKCGDGAPANTCLKTCDKAVPPCIMTKSNFKAPDPKTRTAGTDCNEAVKDWRAKVAAAVEGGKKEKK